MAQSLWIVRMVREAGLRDAEGRLLREARAPAECIRPGEIEYKACPYAGSRQFDPPMPMNLSALRQTSAHWDDIVNAIALMRVGYEQLRGGTNRMELWDVWRVTQFGSALPWYYVLGHGDAAPAYSAALAKATLGMGIWAQKVFQRMMAENWKPPPLTSQAIHELAEQNLTYLAEREVCAGPEKMLLRFYDAMLDLEPEVESPQMKRLVDNRDSVLRFGAHYVNMKLALYLLFLARRYLYADLVAMLPGHPACKDLQEMIDTDAEPPDFFVVGPENLAAIAPAHRAAWFAMLATNILPLAPDQSDVPLRAAMIELAKAMALTVPPPALVEEMATTYGREPVHAEYAARAIATWGVLDGLLGTAMRVTENGMRGAVGAPLYEGPIEAGDRDQLVGLPGRDVLAALAPRGFAAVCPA